MRQVLDQKDYYWLGTEMLECGNCKKTFVATDARIIKNLPFYHQVQFPAILTSKYACDKSLINLMKSRTLGNSSHALMNSLQEAHSEHWMKCNIEYLASCEKYIDNFKSLFGDVEFEKLPPFKDLPKSQWLLSAYVRDVWSRFDECKAEITSTFGDILKIDSTKKILSKLAGKSRKSATWVTNVANEYGALLNCVVTSSESNLSLEPLAEGLMKRYLDANEAPPRLLYTDRDCCSDENEAGSRYHKLFHSWVEMLVRLDIWHWMKRIAAGALDSHPLYPSFLRQLSGCIFEWDQDDYRELSDAKREEMEMKGIKNPSDKAVSKAIKKEELELHCRRRTRGVEVTIDAIENLILSYTGVKDLLGVPLLKQEMLDVWKEEKRHVRCIQDPPNISLYTQTGQSRKGKRMLPKYRCARGSTSLEQFHRHLHQFIPGTRANAVNFQAYLVEGLSRWNAARKDAAECDTLVNLRSFDIKLVTKFNALHQKVFGSSFNTRTPPSKATNECIGLEYLFRQTDETFNLRDLDNSVNDGIEGIPTDEGIVEDIDVIPVTIPGDDDDLLFVDQTSKNDMAAENTSSSTDALGIPGWEKVDALAQSLLKAKGLSISDSDATEIVRLYNQLDDYDKKPLEYISIPKKTNRGKFCKRKRGGFEDVERMERSLFSGALPALPPSKSRVVEAICINISHLIQSNGKMTLADGRKVNVSRWKLILQEYQKVRARVLNSEELEKTGIALFPINESFLQDWFKKSERRDQVTLLMKGREVLPARRISATPLPDIRPKPTNLQGNAPPLEFPDPVVLEPGSSRKKSKDISTIDASKQNPPSTFGFLSPPLSPTFGPSPINVRFPVNVVPTNQLPVSIQQLQQLQFQHLQQPHFTFQDPSQFPIPAQPRFPILAQPRFQIPAQPQISVPMQPVYQQPLLKGTMPKSTYYRKLNKMKSSATATTKPGRCCTKCGYTLKDSGHKTVSGAMYCPFSTVTFEEFREKRLKELEKRKDK